MVALTTLNGRLPAAALVIADTGPNGPQRLRLDAAASRQRMIRDGCPAGHLRSGYRDLAEQDAEVARANAGLTPSAARPGTSGHGEGIDTDDDPPAREWITAHGASYGMVSGLVPKEPWHHEYFPARDQHAHAMPTPPHVSAKPAPTPTPPVQEDTDMPTLIFSGTYGYALLDGGRLIGLGEQASVDAFQAAGVKRIAVTDADFLRMRTESAPGVLLYNAPDKGGRGWAYLTGGHAIGVGAQSTVDALKSQGCPVLTLDAADFARFTA